MGFAAPEHGPSTIQCFVHPLGDVCEGCRGIRDLGPQLARPANLTEKVLGTVIPEDEAERLERERVKAEKAARKAERRAITSSTKRYTMSRSERMAVFLKWVKAS